MKTAFLLGAVVVCFGFGPIFEKLSLREAGPMAVLTIRSVIISVVLLGLLLFAGRTHELLGMTRITYAWIAGSSLVAGLVGLGLYFTVLQDGLASRVAAITASYPIVTALLAVVFLGEPYTLQRFLGTLLVVAGLMLVW